MENEKPYYSQFISFLKRIGCYEEYVKWYRISHKEPLKSWYKKFTSEDIPFVIASSFNFKDADSNKTYWFAVSFEWRKYVNTITRIRKRNKLGRTK